MSEVDSVNIAALPAHLTETIQPWERQPREADRAWQLFNLYRLSAYPDAKPGDVGRFQPRHMTNLARELGLSPDYLFQLSHAHTWAARCNAYDRQIDRERTEATLDDVGRMRATQRRELQSLRELMLEAIAALKDSLRGGTASLRPSELLALVKAVHDGERLLNGEATARTDVRVLNVTLDDIRSQLNLQGVTPAERQRERDALRTALAADSE